MEVVLRMLTQHGVQHEYRGSRMRKEGIQYLSSVMHDRAPMFPYSSYMSYCNVNMKPGPCHEFNVNSIKACEVWIALHRKQGEGKEVVERFEVIFSPDGGLLLHPSPLGLQSHTVPQSVVRFNPVMKSKQK